ncbi:hypothetical protein ACE4RR_08465 [Alteribacillus sp. HJP-4]
MGRAAAEDPPGAGFARLAEALPTESEGLVHCFFTMQKGRVSFMIQPLTCFGVILTTKVGTKIF